MYERTYGLNIYIGNRKKMVDYGRNRSMISYNRLWHLMLDKNYKKTDLCDKAGISSSTLAKLGKNEVVSMEVLERICDFLNCDIGDVMSFRERSIEDA